jgi:hypothetical protein
VSHLDVSDDTDGQHCDVNDPKVEDGKDVNVTTHWDKSGSNDNPPTAPLGEQPPSHDGPSSNGSSQGGDGGGSSHGGHGH